MAKDKVYGFGLVIIFLIGLILYILAVPLPLLNYVLDSSINQSNISFGLYASFLPISLSVALFWLMVPVFGGVFLFCFIVIWIGWTMANTPPPEPIDLDSLDLDEGEEEKGSEKKTETSQ